VKKCFISFPTGIKVNANVSNIKQSGDSFMIVSFCLFQVIDLEKYFQFRIIVEDLVKKK